MENLAVVENGLVNIYDYQEQNERIVDARELHNFLGIGKVFGAWITEKLSKYGFEEGLDYFPILEKSNGGRPKKEYYLKIDTAKEIAMVENNEQGRKVRKYFIEVEKKYKQQNNAPQTSLEVLQAAVNQMVAQEQRLNQIEQLHNDTNNKVTEMQTYLTESPDRKKIEREINTYARRNNMSQSDVRTMIYSKIEDKSGIDVMTRVNNKRNKINKEREEKGKKPYAKSTLKQKYNGMDLLSDLDMYKDVMEILVGLK